ncbi:MAG: CRISPR-associated endoribonuclease Cas6 [Bacteroidota bacterium]|nr:CRISPR-associated endoribonuclease Cas6 [Bacteroidota bacterium]
MRIKLTLKALEKSPAIPINYQYPLSAAIYKILNKAEPQFAELLHSKGYPTTHNRRFKFFTFSKLFFKYPAKVNKNVLLLDSTDQPQLQVTSFFDNTFIQNFIIGIFETQELPIGLRDVCHTTFKIELVESLPEPELNGDLKCTALAPISVSVKSANNQPDYLLALDNRLSKAIKDNLIWKYKTIYETEPQDNNLIFAVDEEYIHRRGGEAKVSKLITIKENEPEETRLKAFIAPFKLSGSKELIQIAYRCGIGEKNSLGFGMFVVVHSEN